LSSSVRIAILAHYQEMSERAGFSAATASEPALIPFGRSAETRKSVGGDIVP
jgi:hypothetical protein